MLSYWKKKLRDANDTLKSDGIVALCRESTGFAYRKTLRNVLPTTGYYTRAGIPYRARKPLDKYVPSIDYKSYPDHEYALVQELRTHVSQGDTVVVIGAGSGTTSIIAANQAAPSGKVIGYEGVRHRVDEARRAVAFNDVQDICEIHHGVVGPAVHLPSLREDEPQAKQVLPEDIPDCDVMELDCEGAEKEILESLENKPQIIIVETHPEFDTGPDEIRRILEEQGYKISNRIDRASVPVLTAEYKR